MSHNHSKHQDKTQVNPEQPNQAVDDIESRDDLQQDADQQNTETVNADDTIESQLSDIDALNKQLDETRAQVEKEKKEYLFLMAEFDNFRKRTVKEKSEIIKNASESVLKGLLPIVDDFERGIEANANTDEASAVRQGMELIYQKLVKFLATNGVKPIESTGKPFDAELHEAIAMVPVPDDDKKGLVIDTPTKGYTINDKVLRHAKVVVGQ